MADCGISTQFGSRAVNLHVVQKKTFRKVKRICYDKRLQSNPAPALLSVLINKKIDFFWPTNNCKLRCLVKELSLSLDICAIHS